MYYFHGSQEEYQLGDGIFPNPDGYTNQKEVAPLEALFEEERPENIEHKRTDCIFLCDNERDIDNAGGFTDYIYLIDIEDGFVEASDMSWYTQASFALSEGDEEKAREYARKYWNGDILEGVMEYRTDKGYIVEIL